MKAYLITSGTLFALLAVLHVFVTFEHWRRAGSDLPDVLGPAVICIFSASLAIWAFRLTRAVPSGAV